MPTTKGRRRPVYWTGPQPDSCDICPDPIGDEFVDGRTKGSGPWHIMCANCHELEGVGFGVGSGLRYTKQADGRFLKTAG